MEMDKFKSRISTILGIGWDLMVMAVCMQVVLLIIMTGCSKNDTKSSESITARVQKAYEMEASEELSGTRDDNEQDQTDFPHEIVPLEPVTDIPFSIEIPPLEPITEEPENTPFPHEIVPLTPVTEEPESAKPTATPKPTQPPRNADWVLSVDDNVTLSIEGITYDVNLYVSMNKSGGKDIAGTYTGKILYTCTVDESELKKLLEDDTDLIFDSGYMNFTMEAVSANIEVVKFNTKEYGTLAGTASERADYMAVGVIDMRMRHQSHLWSHSTDGSEGEGWTPDMNITKPIQVRFLITGGQVKACVGNDPGGEAFSGMITGTPR